MNQATQEPVEVSLIDKLNWLLNERILAEQQVNLQGFSAILNDSDRLREAHAKAFDLVPEILAALNTRAEVGGEAVAWRYDPPKGLMDAGAPPVLRLYRDPHMSHYGYAGTPLFAHPPAPTTSPDVAALREAAIALRDDMLERARNNAWQNDGDVVVEAGAGVWARFNRALDELETLRAGEK